MRVKTREQQREITELKNTVGEIKKTNEKTNKITELNNLQVK